LHPWNWQQDYPLELAMRQLYTEEDKNILLGIGRLRTIKGLKEQEKRDEDKREAERQAQAAETERLKREAGIGAYKYAGK
jgi:hypothetical protein